MTVEVFDIQTKCIIQLNQATGNAIVPLYSYTPYAKTGYRLFSEWLEVKDIKATAWVYSTSKIPFPVFELEDSESKQLLTAINLEWKSPRKEMDLMGSVDNGNTWYQIKSYSLFNSDPYPYREYSLGDHSLGANGLLGIRIRDVGYGLLRDINASDKDRVVVYADLLRHVRIERVVSTVSRVTNSFSSSSSIVVSPNPDRAGISFYNNTLRVVYLDTQPNVSTTVFMVKLNAGDYYEPVDGSYTGAYYAVSPGVGNISLEIREFS